MKGGNYVILKSTLKNNFKIKETLVKDVILA